MMEGGFIAASANVENPDEALADMPLVTEVQEDKGIKLCSLK